MQFAGLDGTLPLQYSQSVNCEGGSLMTKSALGQVVGYVRCSVEEGTGVSLQSQEERIKAFCVATGRLLDEVISDDGASGKDLNRAGIKRILADLKFGRISTLVVLKLDRLTRSLSDLLDIVKLCSRRDVALISVTETIDSASIAGRMMLQLLGVFAEFERATIADRVSNAKRFRRQSGKVYSTFVPFGYRREGDKLAPDPERYGVLRMIRTMRNTGSTLQAICDELKRLNIPPPRGKEWRPSSVRAILHSKMAQESAA
jgi:site-specific DNA recombinase